MFAELVLSDHIRNESLLEQMPTRPTLRITSWQTNLRPTFDS